MNKKLKISTTENRQIRVSDEETFIVDFDSATSYNYIALKDLPRLSNESTSDYNFRTVLEARNAYKIALEYLLEKRPDFK